MTTNFTELTDEFSAEVVLRGGLDDTFSLDGELDFSKLKRLIFNFEKLQSIDVSGLRYWLLLMNSLNSFHNMEIIFRNCPKFIIDYINTIEGFLPNQGSVQSFFMPVYCEKCEASFEVLAETEDINMKSKDSSILSRVLNGGKGCELHDHSEQKLTLDFSLQKYLRFLMGDSESNSS